MSLIGDSCYIYVSICLFYFQNVYKHICLIVGYIFLVYVNAKFCLIVLSWLIIHLLIGYYMQVVVAQLFKSASYLSLDFAQQKTQLLNLQTTVVVTYKLCSEVLCCSLYWKGTYVVFSGYQLISKPLDFYVLGQETLNHLYCTGFLKQNTAAPPSSLNRS